MQICTLNGYNDSMGIVIVGVQYDRGQSVDICRAFVFENVCAIFRSIAPYYTGMCIEHVWYQKVKLHRIDKRK